MNPVYVCDDLKNYHSWTFGTLNIQSGKQKDLGAKLYDITKEIARSEITLCCLQEVRYLNYGSKLIRLNNGDNFKFVWCGKKKRRELGVAFIIKDDPRIIVDEPDVKDPRMLAVNISVYGFKIRLVNAYSPTENGSDTQKDAFYRLLEKACKTEDKHRKLIIADDFNATTSISLKNVLMTGRKL